MRPLNSKQRRTTFARFLVLLVVTVALVVVAVFFGFRVPTTENAMYRERHQQMLNQDQEEQNFARKMEEVKSLLDSMDMAGVNADYMERLVSSELADAQSALPTEDSTYRRRMYTNIIQTYLELKDAKASLLRLSDMEGELTEYDELINQYKEDLQQAQRDLDICRQTSKR